MLPVKFIRPLIRRVWCFGYDPSVAFIILISVSPSYIASFGSFWAGRMRGRFRRYTLVSENSKYKKYQGSRTRTLFPALWSKLRAEWRLISDWWKELNNTLSWYWPPKIFGVWLSSEQSLLQEQKYDSFDYFSTWCLTWSNMSCEMSCESRYFSPWYHFTNVMEHFLPWYHFTTVMWHFLPWYHFTTVM